MTTSGSPSFLPPGFPRPEPETIAQLRQSILQQVHTPHPPLPAELAVLIVADEAGIDLTGVDARTIWLQPPDEREALFTTLGALLAEQL